MATNISMDQFRQRFGVLPGQQSQNNGYFSQVFSGIDKFAKQEVSLKIVQHGEDPRLKPTGRLLSRIEKLSHPNLLRYHEHLTVEADSAPNGEKGFELFISEENVGGNLADYILKGISIPDGERVIQDIMAGLNALHDQDIGHGNLKPSNILLQHLPNPHARLTDYGLVDAQNYKQALLTFPNGSLAYIAPEQLLGEAVHLNVDFWALGMIVYEMFRGKYVFGDQPRTNSDFASRIKAGDLPNDIAQIPAPYCNLIRACLIRNPDLRPQKVATLKRILAGEVTWENGKEVKVIAPIAPDVRCNNCATLNPPTEVTCANCGKALTGPGFLKDYRRNNARAVWTIIFFLFCMMPVGFFYYGLHKTASPGSGEIDVVDKVIKAVEFYNDNIKNQNLNSGEDPKKQAATVVAILFGSYYFIFGGLWFLMQFLWIWRASNNLERLGSQNRLYHPGILAIVGIVLFFGHAGFAAFPFLAIVAIPLSGIVPLLMLQEIWRGSNPAYLVQGNGWKTGKGSFSITSWWLLSIAFPILVLLPLIPTKLDFIIQIEWFYLTIAILIAYIVLYIIVLARVNYRQESKYRAWARQGGVVSRRP